MPFDFREAAHLPNRRAAGDHADPDQLPRQRKGTTPQMHGRYPDFDVLAEVDHWDETTRKVVLDRVEQVPPFRFFTEDERTTWSRLNVSRAWGVVMRGVLACFYSHPWSWNEIGFGGPAYPRGYAAFGSPDLDQEAEPWEGREAVHTDPVRE